MIKGWDSETDKGKAILLTKEDSFCEPKSFFDCIVYLSKDRETACYNMDYDGQAVFKWLPRVVRDRLALLSHADYDRYHIRYVKKKFFKVWYNHRLVLTVYDMAQFYNCSLAMAAKNLGLGAKNGIPQAWYQHMKQRLADPRTREKVLAYALQDARLLQGIIDRTVIAFAEAGMKFERPYSNASFAQRVFREALRGRNDRAVEKMARKAYHGGRIECLRTGHFAKAYYYDVHSAYPSAIADLVKPDGKWIDDEKEVREDAVYAFVDCLISIPHNVRVGPIPVRRRNGLIYYPVGTFSKVVCLSEYRALAAYGWIKEVRKVVQHIWPKWIYPFAKVRSLYEQREKFPNQSYAIKIVLNSVYGKTAQVLKTRIRTNVLDHKAEIFDGRIWKSAEEWKSHTSFVYAAEITARIRMRLYREIPLDKVIFFATDGIMLTEPVWINTGPGLGDWSDVEEVKNLLVVGSGVYQYLYSKTDKDGRVRKYKVTKFRGFSASRMDLREILSRAKSRHSVTIKVLRNTSLKQALKNPSELNVLRTVSRKLNVNFDSKRHWPKRWTAGELLTKNFNSDSLIHYAPITMKRP